MSNEELGRFSLREAKKAAFDVLEQVEKERWCMSENGEPMSGWLDWCKNELNLAYRVQKDSAEESDKEYWEEVRKATLELCKVFLEHSYSAVFAATVMQNFERLVRWLPLTPLTGEENEWLCQQVSASMVVFRNKRCPTVFETVDGEAYQDDHYLFVDEDGRSYTNHKSLYKIKKFPFMPWVETVYVKPSGWKRLKRKFGDLLGKLKEWFGRNKAQEEDEEDLDEKYVGTVEEFFAEGATTDKAE